MVSRRGNASKATTLSRSVRIYRYQIRTKSHTTQGITGVCGSARTLYRQIRTGPASQ